jgi:hypothetical protein
MIYNNNTTHIPKTLQTIFSQKPKNQNNPKLTKTPNNHNHNNTQTPPPPNTQKPTTTIINKNKKPTTPKNTP